MQRKQRAKLYVLLDQISFALEFSNLLMKMRMEFSTPSSQSKDHVHCFHSRKEQRNVYCDYAKMYIHVSRDKEMRIHLSSASKKSLHMLATYIVILRNMFPALFVPSKFGGLLNSLRLYFGEAPYKLNLLVIFIFIELKALLQFRMKQLLFMGHADWLHFPCQRFFFPKPHCKPFKRKSKKVNDYFLNQYVSHIQPSELLSAGKVTLRWSSRMSRLEKSTQLKLSYPLQTCYFKHFNGKVRIKEQGTNEQTIGLEAGNLQWPYESTVYYKCYDRFPVKACRVRVPPPRRLGLGIRSPVVLGRCLQDQRFTGEVNLEVKYKICNCGLTLTQKWYTDNTLGREISLENKLAERLKLTLDTIFVLKIVSRKEKKSGKLKASYKQDCVSLNSNIDIDFSRPTTYGWAMLAFEGCSAGYQMNFDTAKSKLSQNNFPPGYEATDFQLHIHMNNGTEFGGSIYQKMNEMIETSINLMWTTSSDDSYFGIPAKYNLDIELLYLIK
ncbi:hypothetical protein MG293_009617 [Ovis ammon polii]|uniref:Non-selective voltage-gated ion channel VDAC3 n=1 Tax=Ovis ammon polii TaxID=230172 RepID=A0AAD4U797_OVIAM|nr:hypothetical protein MG293_009617 [Ovis ammon polii]